MALYFKKEDADELKKAPLFMEVANFLGIPLKKVGGLWSILCPLHDDNHYGSCMIQKNNTGAICYVCHEKIKPLRLLMNCGYKYYDSLCILAQLNGNSFQYEQTGKSESIKEEKKQKKAAPKYKYNWQETCFLGLAPQVRNIDVKYTFDEITDGEFYKEMQSDNNMLYVQTTTGGNPLRMLELEDPEAFAFIMQQKAKEKMLDCIVTYDCIKNTRKAPKCIKEVENYFTEGKDIILSSIQKTYEKAEELYKKYGGDKTPTKKELIAEMYILDTIS